MLAQNLTLRVETLYTHVVKVSGTVHRGARIRLGQHQQLGSTGQLSYFRSDRGEALRNRVLACLTQDAEAGTRHDTQDVLVTFFEQIIDTIPQDRKWAVREPGQ